MYLKKICNMQNACFMVGQAQGVTSSTSSKKMLTVLVTIVSKLFYKYLHKIRIILLEAVNLNKRS